MWPGGGCTLREVLRGTRGWGRGWKGGTPCMGGEGVEAGEEGGLGWEGGVEGAGCSWWVVLCSAHARTLKKIKTSGYMIELVCVV